MLTIQSSTNGQPSREFNDIELMRALYDVQDILERALCQYILLGTTAKSLVEGERLTGDGIYLGVLRRYLTKQVMSTMRIYLPKEFEIREDGFDYKFGDVPIHVKFIDQQYDFFKYLDFRFYMANQYYFPNPFEKYWQARGLIK